MKRDNDPPLSLHIDAMTSSALEKPKTVPQQQLLGLSSSDSRQSRQQ